MEETKKEKIKQRGARKAKTNDDKKKMEAGKKTRRKNEKRTGKERE